MALTRSHFLQFYDDIIFGQHDIFCDKWKEISNLIKTTRDFEWRIISPNPKVFLESTIQNCASNDPKVIFESIEKMQKAFYSLMLYAINIIRYPTKKEFQVIKRYTGYYKFNIDLVMGGLENNVFQRMGYILNEKHDEFRFDSENMFQKELAWELYLSYLYCSHVHSMFEKEFEKGSSGYDAKAFFLYFYDTSNYTKEQPDFLRDDFRAKNELQHEAVARYEEIAQKNNTSSYDDQRKPANRFVDPDPTDLYSNH